MLWLAACAHPDPPPPPPDTGSSDGPGCHRDPDNALRLQCRFERDGTGPIEVRVTGDDGTVAFPGDETATSGIIRAWDLVAETEYRWELVDRGSTALAGTVTTPALPASADLQIVPILDGPTSVSRALFSLTCGDGPTLFAIDGEGRVRWYQPVGSDLFVTGFDATDRGSVLANIGRSTLREWGWDGELRAAYDHPEDLPRYVHHGVIGRNGLTVALDTEPEQYPDQVSYLVDGLTTIDADGVATHAWDIGEVIDPQGLPGQDELYWLAFFGDSVDFAHENSVDAVPGGGWLVSFKHLSTVVRLDDDWSLRWWMAGGTPERDLDGPQLALGSVDGIRSGFSSQHHVTAQPDGTLLMFDNESYGALSRVLRISVDEGALTATIEQEWDVNASCPVQSSAFALPDGAILASCTDDRQVLELDDQGARRITSLACGDDGPGSSFVRVQPIDRITP